MLAVLILPFLREIAGTTFFHHHENAHQKLTCSQSGDQSRTGWWFGGNSLQTFRKLSNKATVCKHLCNKRDPCYTEGKELDFNFTCGGIIACKNITDNKTLEQVPLFTNEEHCRTFDFFIVATTKTRTEKKKFSMNPPQEKTVFVEQNNFSLPCQFKLKKNNLAFTVYWIKETNWSTCLFSATNEDCHSNNNLSYDVNCCVDAGIRARRLNNSRVLDVDGQNHSHEITIVNVTPSDSGKYLCVVHALVLEQGWMIVTNISVKVQKQPLASPVSGTLLVLSLGVAGGLFLLIGIILFLCWKKKSRGRQPELRQRDQRMTEMEGDDCSPYAISSRNDISGNEALYSVAMSPGEKPNAATSLTDGTAASGREPGENLQAFCAVVNKH